MTQAYINYKIYTYYKVNTIIVKPLSVFICIFLLIYDEGMELIVILESKPLSLTEAKNDRKSDFRPYLFTLLLIYHS